MTPCLLLELSQSRPCRNNLCARPARSGKRHCTTLRAPCKATRERLNVEWMVQNKYTDNWSYRSVLTGRRLEYELHLTQLAIRTRNVGVWVGQYPYNTTPTASTAGQLCRCCKLGACICSEHNGFQGVAWVCIRSRAYRPSFQASGRCPLRACGTLTVNFDAVPSCPDWTLLFSVSWSLGRVKRYEIERWLNHSTTRRPLEPRVAYSSREQALIDSLEFQLCWGSDQSYAGCSGGYIISICGRADQAR